MVISRKLAILNIISLLVFIFILVGLSYLKIFPKLDLIVNSLMPSLQNNFFASISKIIDFIFDTEFMILVSLILSAFIWFTHSKKESLFFAITIILNAAIVFVLKELVQRARPSNALLISKSFAFPSGHTTNAVVFFGLLIYLIFKKDKSKNLKIASISLSIFMIFLIAFTRLYLNLHWLTDVLGGLTLGTFVLTSSIITREYLEKEK